MVTVPYFGPWVTVYFSASPSMSVAPMFPVTVSDGKFNILTPLSSHSAKATDDVTVLNPTVQRAILAMPAGVTKPVNPRYSEDGQSIYFAAIPAGATRQEIYQINIDGTGGTCLTCGVAPSVTANLCI